jgi:hypothetical protein
VPLCQGGLILDTDEHRSSGFMVNRTISINPSATGSILLREIREYTFEIQEI